MNVVRAAGLEPARELPTDFHPATAFTAALKCVLRSGLSLHPSRSLRCCPSSLYTFPAIGAWLGIAISQVSRL
jgi:hypothetical protein